MIRKILREYYLLSRGEQRAMVLLSLLVILTLGFRVAVGVLPAREPAGVEQFQEEAMALLARIAYADSLYRVSEQYGTSERVWSTPTHRYSHRRGESRQEISPVNLNVADSVTFLTLPGIGPVFAGRIVKYRRLLGGYCRIAQLSEIYGMSQETVEVITPLLLLDTAGLEKLFLNRCSFSQLLKHPYLEYEDVKTLVQYIDSEGRIGSHAEIRENGLLADSTLEKIAPYLDFSYD
ncbi:MAG: helix-hairpin-helix domain-containing protein [Bacteroidales bacterium]